MLPRPSNINCDSGPGDPFLAPDPSCVAESLIETIRYLHNNYLRWTTSFNTLLHERLKTVKSCKRPGDETSLTQVIFNPGIGQHSIFSVFGQPRIDFAGKPTFSVIILPFFVLFFGVFVYAVDCIYFSECSLYQTFHVGLNIGHISHVV